MPSLKKISPKHRSNSTSVSNFGDTAQRASNSIAEYETSSNSSSNARRNTSHKGPVLPAEIHINIAEFFQDVKSIIKSRLNPELKDYIITDIVHILKTLVKNKKFATNDKIMRAHISNLLKSRHLSKITNQQVYNIMVFFQMLKHTGMEEMQFTDAELITMSKFKNITIAEKIIKLFTKIQESGAYPCEYFFIKHFIIYMIHNPRLYEQLLAFETKTSAHMLFLLCVDCSRRFRSELREVGDSSGSIEFRHGSNEAVHFVQRESDAIYAFKPENTNVKITKLNKDFLDEYNEGSRNIVGLINITPHIEAHKRYKSSGINSFNKFINIIINGTKPNSYRHSKQTQKKPFFKFGAEATSESSSVEN